MKRHNITWMTPFIAALLITGVQAMDVSTGTSKSLSWILGV